MKTHSISPSTHIKSCSRITKTMKLHLNNISTHIKLMLWRHKRNEMAPEQHPKTHQTHALAIESDNYKRVDGQRQTNIGFKNTMLASGAHSNNRHRTCPNISSRPERDSARQKDWQEKNTLENVMFVAYICRCS